MKGSIYRTYGKRAIDVTVALVVLILASPILIAIGVLLYFANNGKVFFLQERPGLHGRPFKVYKFKSMTDEVDASGQLLPDEQRTTKVGRLVRKSSIDELLQAVNVLLGDMSLVGPRPLLNEYLPLYSEAQARRHEVLPGITGLAQIKGRNALSWGRRLRYDVFYVDHISFGFDLLILILTVGKVFKAEGVTFNPSGAVTKFQGVRHAQKS